MIIVGRWQMLTSQKTKVWCFLALRVVVVQLCGIRGETSTQQAGVQMQQPTNEQGDDLPF